MRIGPRPLLLVCLVLAVAFFSAITLRYHRSKVSVPVSSGSTLTEDAIPGNSTAGLPIPKSSSTPTSEPTSRGFDTVNWMSLKNRYGWSVKYPSSWSINTIGSNTPEEDTAPYLEGPDGCYLENRECGYFSISIWPGSASPTSRTQQFVNLSAKDFLLATEFPQDNRVILTQGDISVGGGPAYFVAFRQTNYEDYPGGILMKMIATKVNGKFYEIVFYETGKDKALISSFRSPESWSLNAIFEGMLSSVQFDNLTPRSFP